MNLEIGIVSELSEDARKPFKKIAQKLGASQQTIKSKYEELLSNKIIQHCSIAIDLHKLGYKGHVHILIKSPSNAQEIIEVMRFSKNIIIATRTFGEYQVYGLFIFKEIDELQNMMLKLRDLLGVTSLDFSIAVPCMQYFPPNDNIFSRLKENSGGK